MNQLKGIIYAAVSSATFGLAPFFSISLLAVGFSSFEVLTYRWGVATVVLLLFGFLAGCNFRLGAKEFMTVFGLSLFRAVTSFSLVIAYQNIASGVASIIHFMYPLGSGCCYDCFLQRKRNLSLHLLPYCFH
jgi:putative membrane protein